MLVAASLACRAAGRPAPPVTDTPFQLFGNNVFVTGQVGGSRPLSLLFDTGAGASLIDSTVTAALQLKANGDARLLGGGGATQITSVSGQELSVGDARVRDRTLYVTPLETLSGMIGKRVDAILGHDFISSWTVEIDYAARRLRLHDPRTFVYSGRGVAIPMRVEDRSPHVVASADLDTGRVEGEFGVDTGSTGTLWFGRKFADTHDIASRLTGAGAAPAVGSGLVGASKTVRGRVRRITLGPFVLQDPFVAVSRETSGVYAEMKVAGTLGGELLRRFTVILDYGRGRLILEPNEMFSEAFHSDVSGLDLAAEGADLRTFRVRVVLERSPASTAGVRVGDVLLAIDGHPAASYDLDQIARMLREPGRDVELALRREGVTYRVRLSLTSPP